MRKLLSIFQDESITSVVIGKFDGLHRAHRQLFSYLDEGGAIVVIQGVQENLTPGEMKQEFSSFPIYVADFNSIRHLSGEEFFYLLQKVFPCLKKIVVGYDFRCGKNRSFQAQDISKVFDGEVKIIPEIHYKGRPIHASDIRKLLMDGKIHEANELLGRAYIVEGSIVKGQGIGRKELVPTINIKVYSFLIPKDGVYCTYTQLNDELYSSITFVGKRVTTDNSFAIETHLLAPQISTQFPLKLPSHASFSFYSLKLPSHARIHFLKYLRANRKFVAIKDLKQQIKKDILETKLFHKAHSDLLYNIWFAKDSI